MGEVNGVLRPLLNGEFLFQFGTLDQGGQKRGVAQSERHTWTDTSHAGYWPDGIYTPPSREAMVYDLEVLKGLGANMVRKHVSGPLPAVVATLLGANVQ